MNELEQLKKEVADLKAKWASLESADSISLSIDQAFRARFLSGGVGLSVSTKTLNSEDILIDEAGNGTSTVLDDPDYWLKVTINNTTYHIPAYNN